jgi:polyhydroxyalkanoate synthesis regulator phasin
MGDRQMNPDFIEQPLPEGEMTPTEAKDIARDRNRRLQEARGEVKAIKQRIKEHGEQARDELTKKDLEAWHEKVRQLEQEKAQMAAALVVTEYGTTAPDTFVLYRGNPHAETSPELLVEPAFPSVLKAATPTIEPPENGRSTGRRLALAKWIVSAENPLTARVLANRIWQYHFGRGIVRSPSNFGFAGDPPTHPELLDWMATELLRQDWQLKGLQKTILMSAAYQAASTPNEEAYAQDSRNESFWRFDMRRLSAEELRDSVHVVSGAFNPKMFGPGTYPSIPKEVLATQSKPGQGWGNSSPEEQARRSVYVHIKRSLITPILADFDLADTDTTCPVRFVTTQPTQALGMMNSEFMQQQSKVFAERIAGEAGGPDMADTKSCVRRAIEVALVREPTDDEVQHGLALINELETTEGISPGRSLELYCLFLLNLNEFAYLD